MKHLLNNDNRLFSALGAMLIACSCLLSHPALANDDIDTSDFLVTLGSNFTNEVRLKKMDWKGGTRLMLNGVGDEYYLNIAGGDRYRLDGGMMKLSAFLDEDGNFVKGEMNIYGTMNTDEGRISGRLLDAILGDDFSYTEESLSFGLHEVVCQSSISAMIPGGCVDGGLMMAVALHGEDNRGEALSEIGPATVVPVPAAAWLFGSGLLGLIGMGRRRTQ